MWGGVSGVEVEGVLIVEERVEEEMGGSEGIGGGWGSGMGR